jgi:PAS domain-containing protein
VLRDITERKIAEEKILKERDFSKAALDSLPGIVYLFDSEGRFLRWNRNFEQVSEYSPEEISSMSPLDFFSERDKSMIRQKISETFEKGSRWRPSYNKERHLLLLWPIIHQGKQTSSGWESTLPIAKDRRGVAESISVTDRAVLCRSRSPTSAEKEV